MAIPILVVEDGTGNPASNSYVAMQEAQNYFDSSYYGGPVWNALSGDNQTVILVEATRKIDQFVEFSGTKVTSEQALQWPRYGVPNPDGHNFWYGGFGIWYFGYGGYVGGYSFGSHVPSDIIPPRLKAITCELVLTLLAKDRMAEPEQKGLASFGLGNGAISASFNFFDTPTPISDNMRAIISPYGTIRGSGNNAKVSRS